VNLDQKPSFGWWIGLMTLAWALDLAAESRLWTCLPPCHVRTRRREACSWTHHGLVDVVARGPGLRTQLLLAAMLGTSHCKQTAWEIADFHVDPARCEPGLLLADLAGAASLLKLFA